MKRHFEKSTEMKAALIRGDLEEFKKASVWLAEHEISADLPVSWKQHVEGMKDSAHAGRDAADLDRAGLALGSMGRACATCHEQLGSPKVAVSAPPAEGSGAQPHMLRHQWAADRMWEGGETVVLAPGIESAERAGRADRAEFVARIFLPGGEIAEFGGPHAPLVGHRAARSLDRFGR